MQLTDQDEKAQPNQAQPEDKESQNEVTKGQPEVNHEQKEENKGTAGRKVEPPKEKPKRMFYPVAPDGYVPNSVIRRAINHKPSDTSIAAVQSLRDHLPKPVSISEDGDSLIFQDSTEESSQEEVRGILRKDKGAHKDLHVEFESNEEDMARLNELSKIFNKNKKKKRPPPPGLLQKIVSECWMPGLIPPKIPDIAKTFVSLLDNVSVATHMKICEYIVAIQNQFGYPKPLLDQLVTKLSSQLNHQLVAIRVNVIKTLGDLDLTKKSVIQSIVPLLASPEMAVRHEAATAMKKLVGIKDRERLVQLMDKSWDHDGLLDLLKKKAAEYRDLADLVEHIQLWLDQGKQTTMVTPRAGMGKESIVKDDRDGMAQYVRSAADIAEKAPSSSSKKKKRKRKTSRSKSRSSRQSAVTAETTGTDGTKQHHKSKKEAGKKEDDTSDDKKVIIRIPGVSSTEKPKTLMSSLRSLKDLSPRTQDPAPSETGADGPGSARSAKDETPSSPLIAGTSVPVVSIETRNRLRALHQQSSEESGSDDSGIGHSADLLARTGLSRAGDTSAKLLSPVSSADDRAINNTPDDDSSEKTQKSQLDDELIVDGTKMLKLPPIQNIPEEGEEKKDEADNKGSATSTPRVSRDDEQLKPSDDFIDNSTIQGTKFGTVEIEMKLDLPKPEKYEDYYTSRSVGKHSGSPSGSSLPTIKYPGAKESVRISEDTLNDLQGALGSMQKALSEQGFSMKGPETTFPEISNQTSPMRKIRPRVSFHIPKKNENFQHCDYHKLLRRRMHHHISISRYLQNKKLAESLCNMSIPTRAIVASVSIH